MINWKYAIASFCIPLNVILIIAGIVISDPYAIILASVSIGLVLMPILRDYNEKEDEKDEDQEASPR